MIYKILVVDDDRAARELIVAHLKREGYEVVTASDGEEALTVMEKDKPDIVLLDLIMPKLGGFEVLKEIRARYQKRWIPVIILSGKDDLESTKKSYALDADHYLTKPCDLKHVVHGIQTMISLMQARKQSE